jgi:DNA-binding response OmpR family regulator
MLSDVHMHPRAGFDSIKSRRSDEGLEHVRLVFISSTVLQERDRLNGLDLGAVRFILRPADAEVLLNEIESAYVNGGSPAMATILVVGKMRNWRWRWPPNSV